MFTGLARKEYSYQLIILIIIILGIWIPAFIMPVEVYIASDCMSLYKNLHKFVSLLPPVFNVLLAFIFTIVQAFILSISISRTKIIKRNSFIIAIVFVLLSGFAPQQQSITPSLIASFFIISAISIFIGLFNQKKTYQALFNIGILIGVASMFFHESIVFLPLIFIGLFIYRINTFREWVIPLSGFFIPFLFAAVFNYWNGNLTNMYSYWKDMITTITPLIVNSSISTYVFIITSLLLALFSIIHILLHSHEKTISDRKKNRFFILWIIFSVLCLLYSGGKISNSLLLVISPLSVMTSIYLNFTRNKFLPNMLLTIIVMSIIYEHLINPFI